MAQKNESLTIYIAESVASRCYTSILRHCLEGMGVRGLTLGNPFSNRMEAILDCIRQCDAVLSTGTPDAESAVSIGAAAALDRPVLYLCDYAELTSPNVAAAVSKLIHDTDNVVADIREILQPM